MPGHRRPRLGQHFLQSPAILDRITGAVRAATPGCGRVLEIGAGAGALTERLLELGLPVVAIEIDPHLAASLRTRFAGRLEVLESDVL
ncbi:MAG TPA: rRNA adenine N-6-methyltransferase family protein, partial [Anaerolineales bacterium]|nr:rRNA adenine N-6-methyltransferase family protein [Anaerolineales bacterium]